MRIRTVAIVWMVCALAMAASGATTLTVDVNGAANIFGAGLMAPPPMPDTPFNHQHWTQSGPGQLPPAVDLTAFSPNPYLVLHFPTITGGVGFNATSGVAGPEGFSDQYYGPTLLSTNIDSTGGISGIAMTNRVLFLVGVFLGGAQPSVAPAALSADGANSVTNFNPLLGQTFFIGDGRTDGGSLQNFYVPTGATHLHLGFADAWIFGGAPSWYGDNHGALNISINVDTPDPATVWLIAAPLAFVWYRARRRRA
jgi:hypothetical protein